MWNQDNVVLSRCHCISSEHTFSNWCTLKMPLVSLPWEPTSCRKHDDMPAYFLGRSSVAIHSFLWKAAMGCSAVAMRYFSSVVASSAFSLPLPTTFLRGGTKCLKGQRSAVAEFRVWSCYRESGSFLSIISWNEKIIMNYCSQLLVCGRNLDCLSFESTGSQDTQEWTKLYYSCNSSVSNNNLWCWWWSYIECKKCVVLEFKMAGIWTWIW